MKFLILGANFQNKGAQAMLFTTVSELKKRFPDCEILVRSREDEKDGYGFKFIYDLTGWDYAKGGLYAVKSIARAGYLKITGSKNSIKKTRAFIEEISTADAYIDISGYSLSSQRGVSRSISYLEQIRVAKELNIPYFIMPQSIGPFDYGVQQKKMDRLLKEYLSYPVIILPREEEGYRLLKDKYGLNNVEQSYDLVLQNKEIKMESVFIDKRCMKRAPVLESENNVAIIPNVRNFTYVSKENLNELYVSLIKRLQQNNKTVYLVRHSAEDLEACQLIMDALDNREKTYLIEDNFDCLQFNGLVRQMDYIIGSRYHGIVHAMKNSVPAIVLGWATKYQSLLSMFDQERFLFDVRGEISMPALMEAVDDMELNWKHEKQVIASRLGAYQQHSCFDHISTFFEKKK